MTEKIKTQRTHYDNIGVSLYDTTSKLLRDSGILNIFSINRLVNYSLADTIPKVLKDLEQEDSVYYKYADAIKRRNLRSIVTKLKQEEKSKFYFFARFIQDLKALLNRPYVNDDIKKKRILKILDLFILESQTFSDNDSITESLKKYRNGFSKTKATTKIIADLLNVELVDIDKKEIDNQELQKIQDNLEDLKK